MCGAIVPRLHTGIPGTSESIIALALVAAIWTLAVTFFGIGFLDGLPRSMEGEAVVVPWHVCVAGYVLIAVALPWVLFGVIARVRRVRITFLLLLAVFALFWLFAIGFIDLLESAWRRGL